MQVRRGAPNTHLSKDQRDLISLVKDLRGIEEVEAKKICQKYSFNKDTIVTAIQNMFEDDRQSHQDEDWKDISRRRRKKKKEERAHTQGRGGRGRSGRGRDDRRGGRGRSRGGRGRRGGRRGRDGASHGNRNVANKENTPKPQEHRPVAPPRAAKVQKPQWGAEPRAAPDPTPAATSVLTNPNPAFNPNWGKPKAPLTEPGTWENPKTESKTAFPPKDTTAFQEKETPFQEEKPTTRSNWMPEANGTSENTADAYQGFQTSVPQSAPWGEEKPQADKWSSWGSGGAATTDIQPVKGDTSAEIPNDWSSSKADTRGSRTRKKVQDSIGINRLPGRNYQTTSKWRKKVSESKVAIEPLSTQQLTTQQLTTQQLTTQQLTTQQLTAQQLTTQQLASQQLTTQQLTTQQLTTQPLSTQESKTSENIIESTQAEIGKLTVSSKPNEPDVILPSYVNNVEKSDSTVHFGLNEDLSQQSAHDQFLRNQASGEIMFGGTEVSNFSSANPPPLRENIQNVPSTSSTLQTSAPSLPKSQTPIQPSTTQAPTAVSASEPTSDRNISSSSPETLQTDKISAPMQGQTATQSSENPAATTTGQPSISMQGDKPTSRAIGEQSMMYPPHSGYSAPMHPQYGMPSGDSRNTFSMYDQNSPAAQMHHPGPAAFYPEYTTQLAQQQRYRGVNDPRIPHQRNRVYKSQANKGPKGLETVKDSKKLHTASQSGDSNTKGRSKQQRGFNQNYKVQRGYKQQGHGMKQNFPKGNFNQKQRQNMPQPFNQQTYPMGAPVQYQPSAMPYAYPNYYNFYHQNAQFSPPGFRNAPYYPPAPNGYNFHTGAPGTFHNPQAPANYEEHQYPSTDGKSGYQSQPLARGGQPPAPGGPLHPQQQQHQTQHPGDSVGGHSGGHTGFSQQIQNGSKHPQGPHVDHSRSQDVASHGFDSAPWTTQTSVSSSAKISESAPQGKPVGNTMVGTGPSQTAYQRPNFYMTPSAQSGFPAEQQQMSQAQPQQQQPMHSYTPTWSSS